MDVVLTYEKGLNPYYGLVDIAVKHGIFEKVSTRIQLPNGTKIFEKQIYDNPEKYFTDEIMWAIEKKVDGEFKYGNEAKEIPDESEE